MAHFYLPQAHHVPDTGCYFKRAVPTYSTLFSTAFAIFFLSFFFCPTCDLGAIQNITIFSPMKKAFCIYFL